MSLGLNSAGRGHEVRLVLCKVEVIFRTLLGSHKKLRSTFVNYRAHSRLTISLVSLGRGVVLSQERKGLLAGGSGSEGRISQALCVSALKECLLCLASAIWHPRRTSNSILPPLGREALS